MVQMPLAGNDEQRTKSIVQELFVQTHQPEFTDLKCCLRTFPYSTYFVLFINVHREWTLAREVGIRMIREVGQIEHLDVVQSSQCLPSLLHWVSNCLFELQRGRSIWVPAQEC